MCGDAMLKDDEYTIRARYEKNLLVSARTAEQVAKSVSLMLFLRDQRIDQLQTLLSEYEKEEREREGRRR